MLPFAAVACHFLCAHAASATPTGRLVYSRSPDAESCPDEASLRRAVAARVGYDPFFPWARRTVVASMERRGRAFVATVSLVDEQGVAHGGRELQTRGDCAELADAAALAIAIAIDPEIFLRPAAPAPEAPPETPAPAAGASPEGAGAHAVPAPAAPPPAVRTQPPPPAARCPGVFEVNLGAVAAFGGAPNVAAGLDVGAQLRWCNVSVGVEGQASPPASRSAEGGGHVSSSSVLGAVLPCAYLGPVFGCAIVQGGALRLSSGGVPDQQSKWTPSWGAGGRVGVLFPVGGRAFVRVHSDWLGNFDRIRLDLRGMQVWKTPPVESTFGADLSLRFP